MKQKKLSLKKEVISDLERSSMSKIRGGELTEYVATCPPPPVETYPCTGTPCTQGYDTCPPYACVTKLAGYECFAHSVEQGLTTCG